MLMCDKCYSLFKESLSGKLNGADDPVCPISGCQGSLVVIDSGVSYLISQLNKTLLEKRINAKSRFCAFSRVPSILKNYVVFGTIHKPNISIRGNERFLPIETFREIAYNSAQEHNKDAYNFLNKELSAFGINKVVKFEENPFYVGAVVDSNTFGHKEFKYECNVFSQDNGFFKLSPEQLQITSLVYSYIFRSELISFISRVTKYRLEK